MTQPAERWVSCRAESWSSRAVSIPDNPAVAPGASSIAAGFTFQIGNQASYWPILILPIGQIMPKAAGFF